MINEPHNGPRRGPRPHGGLHATIVICPGRRERSSKKTSQPAKSQTAPTKAPTETKPTPKETTTNCPYCGCTIDKSAKRCPGCGVQR